MRPRKTKRERALLADCPTCGVKAGVRCENGKGDARLSMHQARLSAPKAFVRQIGRPSDSDGFFAGEAWRRLRYQALKRQGGSCQCCGASGSRSTPLHVDHIKPRSRFPALELDLSNLQVLCADCNLGKGAWDQTDWRPAARGAA